MINIIKTKIILFSLIDVQVEMTDVLAIRVKKSIKPNVQVTPVFPRIIYTYIMPFSRNTISYLENVANHFRKKIISIFLRTHAFFIDD